MSMKDSRRHQGSSSNARLNCKKRGQEEPKDISGRKQKVASGLPALDADANNPATWTRNVSLQKVHCANTSTQANADTVARNLDPSYNVQKQAITHGGSMRHHRSSSDARLHCKKRRGEAPKHIPERKKQKVASAFAALDADANNQFTWISQKVPCANTSTRANANVQDNLTRTFHPSYDVPRQAMNHGCRIYRQWPVSPRNSYIYNTFRDTAS